MYQLKRQIPPANSMKKLWKKEKYICTRRQIWRHLTYTSKRSKRSPVAMTPHKSKSYRCLLDISFHMPLKQKLFESVNAQTIQSRRNVPTRDNTATFNSHHGRSPRPWSPIPIFQTRHQIWILVHSCKKRGRMELLLCPPLAYPCQLHWWHKNCGPQQPTNGLVWNPSFLLL